MKPFLASMLCISLFIQCCGTSHSGAQDTMNRTIAQLETGGRVLPDSESFREVKRLARLANQAAADGNHEQAVQYQTLVAIQIAVAEAAAVQIALTARLAAIRAENESIQSEIDTVTAAVKETEIAHERARIRAHVVSVVDESRRKAAADEELRARFKGEKFTTARILVGSEILLQAKVRLVAAEAYAARGWIKPKDVALLKEAATAAETALAAGDLFQVQMISEHLAVNAGNLLESAWADTSSAAMEQAVTAIVEFLETHAVDSARDSTGCWIFLGSAPIATNKTAEAALATVAALYKEQPSIHFHIFSTVSDEKAPKTAKLKSEKAATTWAEKLKALGVATADIHATGCGTASPFPPPDGSTSNTVINIFPIPDVP